MDPKAKALKEFIDLARESGAGKKAVDNGLEAFKAATGEPATKEIWKSAMDVIGSTKEIPVVKDLDLVMPVKKLKEPSRTVVEKAAPVTTKALNALKESDLALPLQTKLPTPTLDASGTFSPDQGFRMGSSAPSTAIETPHPRSLESLKATDPIAASRVSDPSIVEGVTVDNLASGIASGKVASKGGLSGAQKAGVALGALSVPGLIGEDTTPRALLAGSLTDPTKKLTAKSSAIGTVGAGNSGISAGDIQAAESTKKTALKATSYKPEDVKVMLREVDKTPIAYDVSAAQKQEFDDIRSSIAEKNDSLTADYKAELKAARDEKSRKDVITIYASAFETIGLALTTFFAAKTGMELKQDVSSGVRNIKPTDWMSMTKQHLADYESRKDDATLLLKREAEPLSEASKRVDLNEKESRQNAFLQGRDEAKRRDDLLTGNQRATNSAEQLNVKESNDAKASQANAQNNMNTQLAAQEFSSQEKQLDRDSRETVATTRASATREASASKVSSKIGMTPERMAAKEQLAYAKSVAAYQVLAEHPDDKASQKELVTQMTILKGNPKEAYDLIAEAQRSTVGRMLGGGPTGREMLEGSAPGVSPATQAPGAPQNMLKFTDKNGRVYMVPPSGVAAAKGFGWTQSP